MEPAERTRTDEIDLPATSSAPTLVVAETAIPSHRRPWPGDLDETEESHLIRGYD